MIKVMCSKSTKVPVDHDGKIVNMRKKGSGCITRVAHSPFWYVLYYRDGTQVRESTKSTDRKIAEQFLADRLHASKPPKDVLTFTGDALRVLRSPCVYVYWRGEKCLYIGKGCTVSRPLDRNHHRRKFTATANRLTVYSCKSERGAELLEQRLILQLNPRHNRPLAA